MYFWQRFKPFIVAFMSIISMLLLLISDTAAQSRTVVRLPIDRPVYRIETTKDGLYELTYADLQRAGMDVESIDPNTLEMMYRGQSVAYQFVGNDDDIFSSTESILFYSWVLDGSRREKRYVDRQTFWIWSGGTPLRVETAVNIDGDYPIMNSFPEQLIFEGKNDVFWTTNLTNWGNFDPDEWYWDRYGNFFFDGVQAFDVNNDGIDDQFVEFEAARYELDIPNPAPTTDRVQYSGEFLTSSQGAYSVSVALGDGEGSYQWRGKRYVQIDGTTTNDRLWDGINTLRVSGTATNKEYKVQGWSFTGDYPDNRVWFNKLTVNYQRLLQAVNDQLIIDWKTAGQYELHVKGLTESKANNAFVWNVSNRLMPTIVDMANSDITADNGLYQWRISVEDNTQKILVTTAATVHTADLIEEYNGIDLKPKNGAQWIAITHGEFIESTEALAEYRAESTKVSTHTINITDIVYQYGYGFNMPEAIRDYMQEAYTTWDVRPEYLLLVGDATWNLFNKHCRTCAYNSEVQKNYIVTDLVFYDSVSGYMPNDHFYSMLDGNDIVPDIAVGRIPASTSDEVDNVIDKIKLYEAAIRDNAPWVNDILYMADKSDDAGLFCEDTTELEAFIEKSAPDSYSHKTYCMDDVLAYTEVSGNTAIAKETMRTTLFNSVNGQGHGIINYRGHGAVQNWGDGFVSSDNHQSEWKNVNRPTIIISADCLDTDFARTVTQGLGETFLKLSNAGTAAHWGSTGLGYNDEHTIMQNGFYTGITQNNEILTIGDAALHAKEFYIDSKRFQDQYALEDWFEIWSFTLLGDPGMLIPTPSTLGVAAVDNDTVVPPASEMTMHVWLPLFLK